MTTSPLGLHRVIEPPGVLLVGNGYVPGHADLALGLIRSVPSVRELFERRVAS